MVKKDKKILCLFNCTTNNVGGGMKNSALFIIESLSREGSIGWVYAISTGVAEILRSKKINIDRRFTIFEESPAKSKKVRKQLYLLSLTSKANLVYTMAGPAYVKFSIFHIQGLSSAYITHVKYDVFKINKSIRSNVKLAFKIIYQLYKSTQADHFIFQTEAARVNYCKRAFVNFNKTSVISNAFDLEMQKTLSSHKIFKRQPSKPFTIFCPGAAFEHKAFQYIPDIARELKKLTNIPFEFVLTLPDCLLLEKISVKSKKMKLTECIVNYGPYDYSNIASLYSSADMVFVPSLLETFSSTYLEAMIADKILVVSNKHFAVEICEDVAQYIDPLNFLETAKLLSSIIENPSIFKPDRKKCNLILEKYGDHQNRFEKIIKLIYSEYPKIKTNSQHI